VTEPQAKEYTHVQHRNFGSGLAKACCTQAGPAHIAGHVEKAWTDERLSFLACATGTVAPIAVAKRDESPIIYILRARH